MKSVVAFFRAFKPHGFGIFGSFLPFWLLLGYFRPFVVPFEKKRGGRGRFFNGAPLTVFTIESNIDTEKIDAESGFFACFQITSLFLWSEVK